MGTVTVCRFDSLPLGMQRPAIRIAQLGWLSSEKRRAETGVGSTVPTARVCLGGRMQALRGTGTNDGGRQEFRPAGATR